MSCCFVAMDVHNQHETNGLHDRAWDLPYFLPKSTPCKLSILEPLHFLEYQQHLHRLFSRARNLDHPLESYKVYQLGSLGDNHHTLSTANSAKFLVEVFLSQFQDLDQRLATDHPINSQEYSLIKHQVNC